MDRSNHYEAAFEAYLQSHGVCYVAVNEARRAQWGETRLKNLDFIIFSPRGIGYLVDIKGRRYPGGSSHKPRYVWECWSTEDDVTGLVGWKERFGPRYVGLLVFAYDIQGDHVATQGELDLWVWRNRRYVFRAVGIDVYRPHLRVRSQRWRTVGLPSAVYRQVSRPFRRFLEGPYQLPEECPF